MATDRIGVSAADLAAALDGVEVSIDSGDGIRRGTLRWPTTVAEDALKAIGAHREPAPAVAGEMILPPPRAVVSAAYLTVRTDPGTGNRTPGLILEVCPACTARLPLSERQCSCRVPCTWDGCHHDDPMTKLVSGRDDG